MPSEIAFPFAINGNGEVARVSSEVDIARQHIVSALGTYPGERVRQPLYGTTTMDYLFDSNDGGTAGLLEAELRRAVELFVPEVSVDDIVVKQQHNDGVLSIQVGFTLRRTGETAEVVTEIRSASRVGGIIAEES